VDIADEGGGNLAGVCKGKISSNKLRGGHGKN